MKLNTFYKVLQWNWVVTDFNVLSLYWPHWYNFWSPKLHLFHIALKFYKPKQMKNLANNEVIYNVFNVFYSMSHESVRRVTVWDIQFPTLLCTFTFIRGLSIVKFYLSRIALEFYKPKQTKNLGQKRGHRYLFGIFATTLHL